VACERAQMSQRKGLVLDANILLRAVFGQRVRELLEAYEDEVGFYSPDVCFDDARKYIPNISARRKIEPALGLTVLDEVSHLVESVDRSLYEEYEKVARERVLPRDPDDWPIVSVALLLDFPIWTEDQDFFGSGVATWTTDRVELYLRGE
jgi:predicted nucleic acid-binding protein